jgi:murein DD-endopeptidase MepM/ murein hydrolase activator NlpD
VAVAFVAVALRPWEGILGAVPDHAAAVAGHTSAPAGAEARATSGPTSGPQGDGVQGRDGSKPDSPTGAAGGAAATAEPPAARLLAGYEWPIRNARITNSFGAGRPGSFLLDGVTFHDGLDIASFCGARITAAHDGLVLGAGRRTEALLGWVGDLTAFRAKLDAEDAWGRQAITVVIDDGNGFRSVYAHLGVAVVREGETVAAGDLLGYEGASGNATGCHLHFALFDPDEAGRLTLEAKTAKKTKLPPLEVARIDPLLVLPPLEAAGITWGWGAR